MNTDKENNQSAVALRVSAVSIIVNVVLSLLKLLAGIFAHSGAMISDAVHSASDVLSTFVVIIGVKLAEKKPDKEHPYGHERMECVASEILAVVLAATGLGIGLKGVQKIVAQGSEIPVEPGVLALAAAVASMVIKELMYHYTKRAAKQINSGALMADAWHHRSDALSSVGAFAGILGARMGLTVLDPLASVIICVFIEKAAYDIFLDAVNKMVDHSCPDETVDEMKEVIMNVDDVIGIDELKTRLFGAKIYVEVEILMDAKKTLVEAHNTAEEVHDAIESHFPEVKHCMVHVNPDI
ncbi:cation diffusion facilitator family transporter [uncultured Ruminococcus sp.]|uniref:cation diffusion facilitator family transporter n=1 Tax=uncultured Ruminococcus sp. TaxID=165186 RepID=UPI0025F254A4|nr:cation diffusion facilitator family transporter [uncultured Ruminococcus sp.]